MPLILCFYLKFAQPHFQNYKCKGRRLCKRSLVILTTRSYDEGESEIFFISKKHKLRSSIVNHPAIIHHQRSCKKSGAGDAYSECCRLYHQIRCGKISCSGKVYIAKACASVLGSSFLPSIRALLGISLSLRQSCSSNRYRYALGDTGRASVFVGLLNVQINIFATLIMPPTPSRTPLTPPKESNGPPPPLFLSNCGCP